MQENPEEQKKFREIAGEFLKLGFLGFGGPIAMLAMMEEEFARKRRWLSVEQYGKMYAFLKVMPGPISTQMAVYLGSVRAGTMGGLISGLCFVLPSFLIVLGLSMLYFSSGFLGRSDIFSGMQAGALVVILLSTLQLARPYRQRVSAWVVAFVSAVLVWYAPRWEPVVIFTCGLIGIALSLRKMKPAGGGPTHALALAAAANSPVSGVLSHGSLGPLAQLLWISLKSGAFVFGTGLAIVPLLEGETVRAYHWLSHSEFMDGLAMGQITPGPVVITVTFIGYKVAGVLGAFVATAGVFAPAFFNVLVLVPRVWGRFMGSPAATGFAQWAIPSVVGGILGTSVRLGWLTLNSPAPIAAFLIAGAVAMRAKVPAWALIPASGVLTVVLKRYPLTF